MAKRIELQWEVMRSDEEWGKIDEMGDALPVIAADPRKQRPSVYSLLLMVGLVCIVSTWVWTNTTSPYSHSTDASVAVVTVEQTEIPALGTIQSPKAPLEYWEAKFFQEEVEGRPFTKTPLDYWEDKFFQAEVVGQRETLTRGGMQSPKAPLEYWEAKFFQEEVEGRPFTKTPLDYWQDKFLEQEVGMR